MNQHIEKAQQYLATADGLIVDPRPASTMVLLSIAESLLSIAQSMNAMELEDARIQRNADEWNEMCEQEEEVEHYRKVAQPNPAPKADVVFGLPGEICEICQEQVGVTNSRYILDENEEGMGVWICLTCEQEEEVEHYREVNEETKQPKEKNQDE